MPVTKEQLLAYQKRVRSLQAEARALSPQTRQAVERIVQHARKEINDLIRSASDTNDALPARAVPSLQARISGEVDDMITRVSFELQGAQEQAFRAGSNAAATMADAMDVRSSFFAPTTDLLQVAISHTADLVTSIAKDLLPQVNATLSRAALGAVSPFDAMKEIDKLIGKGGATGVSAQAERIVRTEVNRLYSVALDNSMQDLAEKVGATDELEKEWVFGAWRAGRRADHRQIDGQRVPVTGYFTLPDGTKLKYPRDPGGPAKHVINCGCTYRVAEDSILKAAFG